MATTGRLSGPGRRQAAADGERRSGYAGPMAEPHAARDAASQVAKPAAPDGRRVAGRGHSLAVAFVYLRAQAGGDFFADTPFCLAAAELRRSGRRADVFEVYLPRGDEAAAAVQLAELCSRLGEGAYDLCVFEHLWLSSLVDAVAAQGALLLLTEPDAELERRIDLRLLHLNNHRQPLHDLVALLEEGGDLGQIPNLIVELPGMPGPLASDREEAHPSVPDALRPFEPVLDVIEIGEERAEDGRRVPLRKTLDTNKGCPFSAPVATNPAFAAVPMPAAGVTMAGCAFCFMGGDYKALPWRETVPLHLNQIAWYQEHLPRVRGRQLEEVVLRDQHALRYLPQLIEGAVTRGLQPVGFLVPGRGDAILRFGEELRAAARLAEGTGFWFTIYLIGFESFSQAQLDLYNKGVTTADYAAALTQLHALQRTHPNAFRLHAYGASSFILWNPWTTLEDLEATTAFARRHAAHALAHGIGDTRLRLYRHLPLYWKAKNDGLLQDGAAESDEGAPAVMGQDAGARFTGYAAARPWRFGDGRLARCEVLASALLRRGRPADALGQLEAAVAWTRWRWPSPLPPQGREELEAAGGADMVEIAGILAALGALTGAARQGTPTTGGAGVGHSLRGPGVVAAQRRTVLLGGGCNNHCRRCLGEHRAYEVDVERLRQDAERAAAADGRVVFAGREPLLVPALPQLVAAARRAGAQGVEVVTNGRALALPGVARRLQAAGVDVLTVKRHRLADEDEDAATQTVGAGQQQGLGITRARGEAPGLRLRALLLPEPEGWAELAALVGWAADLGARDVTVRPLAGSLPLHALAEVASALTDARAAAAARGVRLDVEGMG